MSECNAIILPGAVRAGAHVMESRTIPHIRVDGHRHPRVQEPVNPAPPRPERLPRASPRVVLGSVSAERDIVE